jgi:aryl-alcohol dehydrogenase-like predicted oxidoreductase
MLKLPALALGCMSLPTNDTSAFHTCIRTAIDAGIKMFDTADLYDKGDNERQLGKALSGIRENVILATKVGNKWREDGSGWDWVPRKAYILNAVDESLRRLETDYLDLYQLHGGTMEDPMDEVLEAFDILKTNGKIRAYGISSIRPNMIRKHLSSGPIHSVMMQYSLADRRPEETILPLLERNEIKVLARGVLAKGLLCGKPMKSYLDHDMLAMETAASAIRACSSPARSPAQTCIRFVMHRFGNIIPVIGVSQPDQLSEMAGTLQTPPLTPEEYTLISDSLLASVYDAHR